MRAKLAVVSLVLLLPACGTQPAAPQLARVRVAAGGQPQLIYLPITLADRLGYYRDEGVEVHIEDFPGGSRALQSLMAGTADVVCGYYDHTVQMAADGKELTAFIALLRYPGLVAVSAPKPRKPIASLADLKGSVVGVTAPGSATHFFINYLLAKNGLRPDEVSITGIGTSASAVSAVERSRVDAAVVVEPTFTLLSRRVPGLRLLADTRTPEGVKTAFGVEEYPSAVLYAPAAWLAAHPSESRALARAIVRTLEWIGTHRPEEIADRVPEFVGNDREAYLEALAHMLPTYSLDGRLSANGTTAVRQVLAVSLEKLRTAPIDLRRTFTNDFVPASSR